MFLVWLGEQITERGIGNGVYNDNFCWYRGWTSKCIGKYSGTYKNGSFFYSTCFLLLVAVVLVTAVVVFVERGQRRITINYAKRQLEIKCMVGNHLIYLLRLIKRVLYQRFLHKRNLVSCNHCRLFGSGESLYWLKDISAAISLGNQFTLLCLL